MQGGIGGPAVDHQGDVVGIVMDCDDDIAIILPISIVLSCLALPHLICHSKGGGSLFIGGNHDIKTSVYFLENFKIF